MLETTKINTGVYWLPRMIAGSAFWPAVARSVSAQTTPRTATTVVKMARPGRRDGRLVSRPPSRA